MRELETENLTEVQRRAREAVRALSTPAADPEFRARLKHEFVTGEFGTAPRRVERLPWTLRPMTRWTVGAAAAAASLVAVLALNQSPEWRLSGGGGEAIAVVDGRPVPMAHAEELARLVRPGARVRIPDTRGLELMSAGQMAIELSPGTDFTVPAVPGRWFARHVSAEVRDGRLHLTTGAGFRGATLAITTPEARVLVTGTTLAVICGPGGTCVCVLEGTVHVGPSSGAMMPVAHGHRGFVYDDGRPPQTFEILGPERTSLTAFREACRPMMERTRR